MGRKFEMYKQRQSVRGSIQATIRRSEDRIKQVSEYIPQERAILNEIENAPAEIKADSFLSMAPALLSPETSEKLLADLQTSHDRFVDQMRQPSKAFPQGVI